MLPLPCESQSQKSQTQKLTFLLTPNKKIALLSTIEEKETITVCARTEKKINNFTKGLIYYSNESSLLKLNFLAYFMHTG